jgi:hypothetical protein
VSKARPSKIDPRTRTAYHEAGHAVLGAAINVRPERVTIRARNGTLGYSTQQRVALPTSLAQIYLAGFGAEHLLSGRRPRSFDVEVGLGILSHLDPTLVSTIEGVEASDGYGAVREVLRSGVREIEDDIRVEVGRLYEVALASLVAVWPCVRSVAEALLVREELDGSGLGEAIGDTDIRTPALAVQRAIRSTCSVPRAECPPRRSTPDAPRLTCRRRS